MRATPMSATPRMRRARTGLWWILATIVMSACVPRVTQPTQAPVETPASASSEVPPPSTPPPPTVDAAIGALADSLVTLSELTLDVARRPDFIRHVVARGPAQRTARSEAVALAEQIDAAVERLRSAVVIAGAHPLAPDVSRGVDELISLSEGVAAQVQADLAQLDLFLALDEEMDAIVDVWSLRGSRSEFAERMSELIAMAEATIVDARHLPATPEGCTDARTNRIRWAELVLERTAQLRDVAAAGLGSTYTELRDRFDRAPYGEDRVVADSESRRCWALRSQDILSTDDDVRQILARLERALSS